MDAEDAGKAGQPDEQSACQMRSVRFPQYDHRQPVAKTVQDHQRDMADEEQDERAKGQEMQTAGGLPPVKILLMYHGKRAATAGDIAIPVAMLKGASRNTTAA